MWILAAALALIGTLSDDPEFGKPARVTIAGYSGDAMEPFITRDGTISSSTIGMTRVETDLHWAERVDELTFTYREKSKGRTRRPSTAFQLWTAGNLYFVTTRSYFDTLEHLPRQFLARRRHCSRTVPESAADSSVSLTSTSRSARRNHALLRRWIVYWRSSSCRSRSGDRRAGIRWRLSPRRQRRAGGDQYQCARICGLYLR